MRFFRNMAAGFVLGCALLSLQYVHAQPAPLFRPVGAAWRVMPIDAAGTRPICAANRVALLKTGMPQGRCIYRASTGDRGERVMLFTCEGSGWGRSVFRSTGAGAMRIETQGISNGEPFAIDYEARSVASC